MAYICKVTDTGGSTGEITTALYGTCSTNADVAAKVVTCASFDKLLVGVTIRVRFDKTNTASSPTLNVNSTGAKAIRVTNESTPKVPLNNTTASWYAGETVEFIYLEDSSTGYWYMTNSHAVFTTQSINNPTVTAKSPVKITAPASGTKWSHITAWTTNTPTSVTLGDALTATKVTLGTALSASKVTLGTAFSIPNVTGNSSVTVKSVKTVNTVMTSATITEGVLAFGTGASVVTEDKTATNTTLGTAFSVPNVTGNSNVSIPNVTGNTTVTIPNVTEVVAGTAASLTFTDYTLKIGRAHV